MSSTPWKSGVAHATHSSGVRQLGEREERAAEQEERVDDEAEDGAEADVVLLGRGERDEAGAKATPMSIANGMASIASGVRTIPNRASTTRKTAASEPMRNADQASSPPTMLADADRGREHRLVVPAPHDLVHDRVGRLEGRGLHRHRRQQAGAEPVDVLDAAEGRQVLPAHQRRRCRGPWRSGRAPAGGTRTPG